MARKDNTMQRTTIALLVLIASLSLAGCELVMDIAKVGFWAGVIVVLLIVIVIWAIVRMIR